MKRLLLACLLVGFAAPAFATGGTANSPFYVRAQQGLTRTCKEVSCTTAGVALFDRSLMDTLTAGDIALVTAAEAANARSILFISTDATNFATLCPVVAAAGVCDADSEGLTLYPKGSLPVDRAIRDGGWSCKGNTGTVVVEVLIEK